MGLSMVLSRFTCVRRLEHALYGSSFLAEESALDMVYALDIAYDGVGVGYRLFARYGGGWRFDSHPQRTSCQRPLRLSLWPDVN